MPITLLVLDLDGTIVGRQLQVSDAVIGAIRRVRERGVRVAVATGRMYRAALPFYRLVGSDLPLVSYQGALVKDPLDGRVLLHRPVPIERTLEVLAFLEGEELAVHLYLNDTLYVRELTAASRRYGERTGVTPGGGRSAPGVDGGTDQDFGAHPGEAATDRLLGALRERYAPETLYLTKSDPTFVEVAHPRSTKGWRCAIWLSKCCRSPRRGDVRGRPVQRRRDARLRRARGGNGQRACRSAGARRLGGSYGRAGRRRPRHRKFILAPEGLPCVPAPVSPAS